MNNFAKGGFSFLLAAAALSLVLLIAPGSAAAGACSGASTPAYELGGQKASKIALCVINRTRAAHGLKPLKADRKQEKAARGHNRAMLQKDCFAHQCSGEKDLVGRMEQAGYLPCTCSWAVGENIAWGMGESASPASIVQAWMNSAPHRANILSKTFDEAGLAIDNGSPAGGDKAATFTMDFGRKQ